MQIQKYIPYMWVWLGKRSFAQKSSGPAWLVGPALGRPFCWSSSGVASCRGSSWDCYKDLLSQDVTYTNHFYLHTHVYLFVFCLLILVYIYIHSVHKMFFILAQNEELKPATGMVSVHSTPSEAAPPAGGAAGAEGVPPRVSGTLAAPWESHWRKHGDLFGTKSMMASDQLWEKTHPWKPATYLEEAFSSCHDDIPQQFSHPLRCIWRSMWNGRKGKPTPATASHLLTYRLRWGTAGATGSCFWISCRKDGWNGAFKFKYLHLLEANPY